MSWCKAGSMEWQDGVTSASLQAWRHGTWACITINQIPKFKHVQKAKACVDSKSDNQAASLIGFMSIQSKGTICSKCTISAQKKCSKCIQYTCVENSKNEIWESL